MAPATSLRVKEAAAFTQLVQGSAAIIDAATVGAAAALIKGMGVSCFAIFRCEASLTIALEQAFLACGRGLC